jgi:hypothetical protein
LATAAIVGPGATVEEVFGYLGVGFLIGAFDVFVARIAGAASEGFGFAIWMAIGAVALTALGIVLGRGDDRLRRAAGLVFLIAIGHAATAGYALSSAAHFEWSIASVVAATIATGLAAGVRMFHPALLTQLGLIGSITALAATLLSWLQSVIVGPRFDEFGTPILGGPSPLAILVANAVWWLGMALVLGLLGLAEARAGTESGGRRAALARIWASLVAVGGLVFAVTTSDYTSETGGRVLTPWIGDLALLILAAILIERAFRRDAATFVAGAALALIAALTDFNFSYLSSSTEVGLLIEGVILLAAGFGADRLRRRVGQRGVVVPAAPEALAS